MSNSSFSSLVTIGALAAAIGTSGCDAPRSIDLGKDSQSAAELRGFTALPSCNNVMVKVNSVLLNGKPSEEKVYTLRYSGKGGFSKITDHTDYRVIPNRTVSGTDKDGKVTTYSCK